MSYSRWSFSKWYVYWDTSSGDTLDDQVLSIDDDKFTYVELKHHLDRALLEINGDEELRGYVKEWLEDVELEFKVKAVSK
jgi:hypothetical protein